MVTSSKGETKKPPQPITTEYKILQELKQMNDVLKSLDSKLDLLCQDIKRNRGG